MDVTSDVIHDFWFGGPNRDEFGQSRKAWFVKDSAFDAEVREQFLATLEAAERGELVHWRDAPKHCLSLVLLLDQFARNIFRDTPRAFTTDAMALETARVALAQKYDQTVAPVERIFFYLPFEHSESLADQEHCVALVQALVEVDSNRAGFLDYATRHRDVIARFGRFPHRNRILSRISSSAEVEFLKQPGSSF